MEQVRVDQVDRVDLVDQLDQSHHRHHAHHVYHPYQVGHRYRPCQVDRLDHVDRHHRVKLRQLFQALLLWPRISIVSVPLLLSTR